MHVGDSRGYLYRAGTLRQLTDDHSVVAEMVRQGQLRPEEAERHKSRNIITRALGAEPDVEVDEVHVPLYDGDMLLLCSDGLSSLVRDAEIAHTIAAVVRHARARSMASWRPRSSRAAPTTSPSSWRGLRDRRPRRPI